MKKPKSFIVPMIIYPFDIMFSINQTDWAFQESLKKYCPEKQFDEFMSDHLLPNMERSNYGTARCIRLKSGWTVIRCNHYDDSPEMRGVLAHEIFHAIEFLFRRIEIKLCGKSDEAYAYAIGYLTTEFYKNYK